MAVKMAINADELQTKLAKAVEGYEKRMLDLEPVLKGRAQALEGVIRKDVFGASQSPTGEPWLPLADATVARRRQGSSKPLFDTGNLSRGVNAQASKAMILVGVSGDAATYAPHHQHGTKHIPARPFIPDADDMDRGPMAAWSQRLRERVLRYILTGKV